MGDNRDETVIDDPKSIEVVPTIRLSEWIQYHIIERSVPKIPPSLSLSMDNNNNMANNGTSVQNNPTETETKPKIKPPVLGMKMDIEGSEYIVLPDLIHTGSI